MPFVTVLVQDEKMCTIQHMKELQRLCKEAWVSLNEYPPNEGFQATDVGGQMCVAPEIPHLLHYRTVILFHFVDRGQPFFVQLFARLRDKLLVGKDFSEMKIILLPAKSEMWFEDPVWSISFKEKED